MLINCEQLKSVFLKKIVLEKCISPKKPKDTHNNKKFFLGDMDFSSYFLKKNELYMLEQY